MSTGAQYADIQNTRLLGRQDLTDRMIEYMRTLAYETHERVYQTGATYDTALGLTGDGADKIQVTGSELATDGSGHILDVDASGYSTGLQFENTAAIDYDVALHFCTIPSGVQINPRTGLPEYIANEEAIGESADPDSVVDNGSTLTFTVNSVAETGVSHEGRSCMVFKKSPGRNAITEALAIQILTVSASNTITTADHMGQTDVSTTAADYTVVMLGPTIRRNTSLEGAAGYCFLGTVTGSGAGTTPGTFDVSGQLVTGSHLSNLGEITALNATTGRLKVDVKSYAGDVNDPQIAVRDPGGSIVFQVDGNGNVVIQGTATQYDTVTVYSSETITDNLTAGDAATDSHLIKGTWRHTDAGGSANFFRVDGTTGHVGINAVPDASAWLDVAGDVLCNNIAPQSDNTYDCGSLTNRWANFFTVNLNVGGDILPTSDNTVKIGSNTLRWSDVYSVSGRFGENAPDYTLSARFTDSVGASEEKTVRVEHVRTVGTANWLQALHVSATNSFDSPTHQTGHVTAIRAECYSSGSGATDYCRCVDAMVHVDGSHDLSTAYNFISRNKIGTGTLTNQYGLYIENLTAGTGTNYGIWIDGATTWGIYCKAAIATHTILPISTNSYNLGSTDNRWSSGFITNLQTVNIYQPDSGYIYFHNYPAPSSDKAQDIGAAGLRWGSSFTDKLFVGDIYSDAAVSTSFVAKDHAVSSGAKKLAKHYMLNSVANADIRYNTEFLTAENYATGTSGALYNVSSYLQKTGAGTTGNVYMVSTGAAISAGSVNNFYHFYAFPASGTITGQHMGMYVTDLTNATGDSFGVYVQKADYGIYVSESTYRGVQASNCASAGFYATDAPYGYIAAAGIETACFKTDGNTAHLGLHIAGAHDYAAIWIEDESGVINSNSIFPIVDNKYKLGHAAARYTDLHLTGTAYVGTIVAVPNIVSGDNAAYLQMSGGASAGNGANIELYGGSHATAPNQAFYDATPHNFRAQNGAGGATVNITAATTESAALQIGQGRTGNGFSYIDLIGDAGSPGSDYGLRIVRGDGGANTSSSFIHRGTGALEFAVVEAGSITWATSNGVRMFLDSAGNLALGTGGGPAPGVKLHASGFENDPPATSGTTQTGCGLRIDPSDCSNLLDIGVCNTGNTFAWLQSTDQTDLSAGYPLVLNPNGGYVGLGVPNPAEAFSVVGDIIVQGEDGWDGSGDLAFYKFGVASDSATNTGVGYEFGGGMHFVVFGTGGNGKLGTNSLNAMYIEETTGNVGFGTVTPLREFHVLGSSIGLGTEDIHTNTQVVIEAPDVGIDLASDNSGSFGSYVDLSEHSAGSLINKWSFARLSTAGGGALTLRFGSNVNASANAELFRFTSDGKLGVGRTPGADLDVLSGTTGGAQPSGTWAAIIEQGTDLAGYHGLSVSSRWGLSTSTIFEVARKWDGSAGHYPIFHVDGTGDMYWKNGATAQSVLMKWNNSTGEVEFTNAIKALTSNGPGIAVYVGNDATLNDINTPDTIGVRGTTDSNQGKIKLGAIGPTIVGKTNGSYGCFGIGEASPQVILHATSGIDRVARFQSTGAQAAISLDNSTTSGADNVQIRADGETLELWAGAGSRVEIDSTGIVRLNTGDLRVGGDSGLRIYQDQVTSADSTLYMQWTNGVYDALFGASVKLNSSDYAFVGSQLYTGVSAGILVVSGGSVSGTGANIELYAESHASLADQAIYDALVHTFRDVDGTPTYAVINSSGLDVTGDITLSGTVDGVNIADDTIRKTGNPQNNQVGIFTGSNVQEGVTALTFDGDNLRVGDGAGFHSIMLNAAAGTERWIQIQSAGSARWTMLASSGAEGGDNAGSDYVINSSTDAGGYLGSPFRITRATGNVGLSASNPGERLSVLGNMVAQGNEGWNSNGDLAFLKFGLASSSTAEMGIGAEYGGGLHLVVYKPSGGGKLGTNSLNAMYLEQVTGYVGVNTTDPETTLHVKGKTYIENATYGAPGTDAELVIGGYDAGGTNYHNAIIDFRQGNGSSDYDGRITIGGAAGGHAGAFTFIQRGNANSMVFKNEGSSNGFRFYVNNTTEVIDLQPTFFHISNVSYFGPATNNGLDLGSSTHRFWDGYISNAYIGTLYDPDATQVEFGHALVPTGDSSINIGTYDSRRVGNIFSLKASLGSSPGTSWPLSVRENINARTTDYNIGRFESVSLSTQTAATYAIVAQSNKWGGTNDITGSLCSVLAQYYGTINQTGTLSNYYGVKSQAFHDSNCGAVTNLYHFYATDSTGGDIGVVNAYGLYIQDINNASTLNYGIYIEGATTAAIHVVSGDTNLRGVYPVNSSTDNIGSSTNRWNAMYADALKVMPNGLDDAAVFVVNSNLTGTTSSERGAYIRGARFSASSFETWGGYITGEASSYYAITAVSGLAVRGVITTGGSQTLDTLRGIDVQLWKQSSGSHTTTNAYGIYVKDPSNSAGTFTNLYGIYVETQTKGTNDYGIYVAGGARALYIASGNAYFGGSISSNLVPTGTVNLGSTGSPWANAYANVLRVQNVTSGFTSENVSTISTYVHVNSGQTIGGTYLSNGAGCQLDEGDEVLIPLPSPRSAGTNKLKSVAVRVSTITSSQSVYLKVYKYDHSDGTNTLIGTTQYYSNVSSGIISYNFADETLADDNMYFLELQLATGDSGTVTIRTAKADWEVSGMPYAYNM
jgi:hypothetical protein